MANNTIDTLVIDVSARAVGAAQGIDLLAASLERLKEAIKGNTGANLLKLATNIERLKASLGGLNVSGAQLDGLSTGLSAVSAATSDARTGVQAVNEATNETGAKATAAASGLNKVSESARRAGDSARSASKGGFSQLIRDIARIAKYRAIRTALKGVTSGVREGMQNLYQYSAALRSTDSANFKNTLDGYATSFLYLKNSIGAAVAPLVQAFLPVIQQVVSWVVAAANAINQFISALQGKSTYTRATEAATQYATATGKGGKAAKKLQNILMGFDEINLIETPKDSGGGGGGASTPDYSKMFEEANIDKGFFGDILTQFDRIKKAASDMLGYIKDIWESDLFQKILIPAAIEFVVQSVEMASGFVGILDGFITNNKKLIGEKMRELSQNDVLSGVGATWQRLLEREIDKAFGSGTWKQILENVNWPTLKDIFEPFKRILNGEDSESVLYALVGKDTYNSFYLFGKQLIELLGDGVFDAIKELKNNKILSGLLDVLSAFNPVISAAWGKIKNLTDKQLDDAKANARKSRDVMNYVTQSWKKVGDSHGVLATRVQNSMGLVRSAYDDVITKMPGFAKRFGNELDNMKNSALSKSPKIGEAVVNGIVYSLNAGQQATYNSMLLLGYTQEEAIKKALEINSPSKVMQRIGGYVVLGLTSGITDGVNNVKTAINGLSAAASDTMKGNATSSIWSTYGKNMMVDIEKGIKGNVGLIVGATKKVAEAASQGLGTYSGYVRWQKEGKYILTQMQSAIISNGKIVSNAFAKNVANPIADIMNLLIKRIIGKWNSMLQEFKSSGARLNANGSISITTAKSYNIGGIPKFASGGYAGPGQLFISREDGPELVSRAAGGGTNIMNNDQIVASVADGVYRAMMDTGFVNYLSDIANNTEGGTAPVFAPSAEAGRWISRSSKMYAAQGGR